MKLFIREKQAGLAKSILPQCPLSIYASASNIYTHNRKTLKDLDSTTTITSPLVASLGYSTQNCLNPLLIQV